MEDTSAEHHKTPAQRHENPGIAPMHVHAGAHIAPAQVHDEQKVHATPSHEHDGHQHHAEKKRFGFMRWLKGGSRQEFKENISYTVIVIGAVMVGVGLALGSAMNYIIYVGAFGGLFVLAGIVIYIVSQLMTPVKGTGEASA